MVHRCAVLAALLSWNASAQFSGLSSSTDGSSLYFASSLRLKGGEPLLNGKIFLATTDGVKLFKARERYAPPLTPGPPCTTGGFGDYLAAESSQQSVVALSYRTYEVGACSYPVNVYATQIVTSSGERDVPGVARLSADGRYAIVVNASTGRGDGPATVYFLDPQTGAETPVKIPDPQYPEGVVVPYGGGRVIANDGSAVVAVANSLTQVGGHGYLVKPGSDPAPFPVQDGLPLMIDSSASKVVYRKQGLRLLDLPTLQSTLLVLEDQPVAGLTMSDDAGRLLFLRDGQAHLVDTAAGAERVLTDDPAKITATTISGDGKFVYAVTGAGRLLKINADNGAVTELIGRTPYLAPYPSFVYPGLAATLYGSALSDTVIQGAPPYNPYLGNVTMWIGERKVPLIRLEPTSVRFLVPWDILPASGSVRVLAEAPGEHTPFYFPEADTPVRVDPFPRAGPIARQNWQQTYVGPVNTGEIIHVFAIGFGPVSPEVPDGAAAPSAEPLSRITRTFTCSNAEILYAGLAPYYVERVYQIDMRIGPTPGYQKFICSLGDSGPFTFLTLNVVP